MGKSLLNRLRLHMRPEGFTKENFVFRIVGLCVFLFAYTGLLLLSNTFAWWECITLGVSLTVLVDILAGIGKKV